MLGYVRVFKPELKVREYEVYCGYYCGVCKSIGKRYGQLPRMALSYDAAFLALLLEAVGDGQDEPSLEHCIAHPVIKKKTIIRNEAIDYAADVMLILAWYKLLDDARDEGKIYAKGTMLMLKGIFKKLQRKHPALCKGIEENLAELTALEKDKCANLDMAAEAFSKIMELIFAEGSKNTEIASIGYHLGKWIYLADAIDDIEENIESGAYNPLLYRFDYDSSREVPAKFRARIEDDLKFNMYHYLAVISNCLERLEFKKNQGIIENIIYFGLNRKTEELIEQKGDNNESI